MSKTVFERSQQGGRHEGFSEHFRVTCAAFPESTKKEFGIFLKLAGTPYARIDWFEGQPHAFIHFRTQADAEISVQAIHAALFKGEDVSCERCGANWFVEREQVHRRAYGPTAHQIAHMSRRPSHKARV